MATPTLNSKRNAGRVPRYAASFGAVLLLAICAYALPFTGNAATSSTVDTAEDGAGTPAEFSYPGEPPISADAWLLTDLGTNSEIGGKGTNSPRAIASLTKLMTALIVTERTEPDDLVTISELATQQDEGSALGMQAGDTYTVQDLLAAMIVGSANDAAWALAEHVGEGSRDDFLKLMNAKAQELSLENTKFTSVHGLDADRGNVSTPKDLVRLAAAAMADDNIAELAAQRSAEITRGDGTKVVLKNRNRLLGEIDGVDGVKTGMTDAAGWCIITRYDDGAGGSWYAVVLGADSDDARTNDARALINWARTLRQDIPVVAAGERLADAPLEWSDKRVPIYAADDVTINALIGQNISERLVVPSRLAPPLRKGDEIGTYEVLVDGEVAGSTPVYVNVDATRPTMRDRIERTWQRMPDAPREGLIALQDAFQDLAAG